MDKELKELFNLEQDEASWEEGFYESAWHVDTLQLTDTEEKIVGEITSFFPRHMLVYDWNLPYAEEVILIIRRVLNGKIV